MIKRLIAFFAGFGNVTKKEAEIKRLLEAREKTLLHLHRTETQRDAYRSDYNAMKGRFDKLKGRASKTEQSRHIESQRQRLVVQGLRKLVTEEQFQSVCKAANETPDDNL